MHLHGLRLFYAVAKNNSVTLAAEQLRISQPAITSQIKKFERETGVTLFSPQGRGIRLTQIGERLAKEAGYLFHLEESMETMVRNYQEGKSGTLKITGNYLASNYLIPPWAAKLKQFSEDIAVEVTTTNTEEAVDRLIGYQSDIAVLGGGGIVHSDRITVKKIMEDELWFVVPPEYRYADQTVGLSDLMAEPFVMREKGSYNRLRLESLCHTFNLNLPKITLEFDGLHETLMASVAGYGVNFCPAIAARGLVTEGKLARVYVKDISLTNEIVVCTRKEEPHSPLVERFLSIIDEQ
jgi:Transcriptional regulator